MIFRDQDFSRDAPLPSVCAYREDIFCGLIRDTGTFQVMCLRIIEELRGRIWAV